MVTAMLCNTDRTYKLVELTEGNTLRQLQDMVGGLIDVVRNNEVVGIIHDEGRLLELEPNLIASAMFGQMLVGPVVVLGCLNDAGHYDGENYDVPADVVSAVDELLEVTRQYEALQAEIETVRAEHSSLRAEMRLREEKRNG